MWGTQTLTLGNVCYSTRKGKPIFLDTQGCTFRGQDLCSMHRCSHLADVPQ